MRITLFTEELRKCLNAAGLSDCGENDAWSYWYNRVLKAHNDAVERQVMTEQAENAKLREYIERKKVLQDFARLVDENSKLRELVRDLWLTGSLCDAIPDMRLQARGGDWRTMQERVDEALGIEEDS